MAPPDPIQSSNASYGVCLPDGSEQGVEILVSTAAPQQSTPDQTIVVGVQNYSEGVSYARPVEVTRQPTNIFQAMPLQGSQKKAAIALGDALQILINDRLANGEDVDPRLEVIAQTLHEGKLPDLDDPDIADLFNRSFSDTALDAVVHSIALQSDSPNRSLHVQALQYSLPYYFQQTNTHPSDDGIRQGLITALSNSGPEGRQVLSDASRSANPAIQTQIQQALANTPANSPIAPTTSTGLTYPPTLQAARVAELSIHGSETSVTPQPSTLARFTAIIASHAPVLEAGAVVVLGISSPVLTGGVIANRIVLNAFSPNASAGPNTTPATTLSSMAPNARESVNFGANNSPSVISRGQETVEGSSPLFGRASLLPIFDVRVSPREIARRTLGDLGLSDSSVQRILDSIPSPFLLGAASIQGGLHQSLTVQATNNSPVILAGANTNPAYRVAAVSRMESGSSEEGFDSSREGSSDHHGEGQGSSSQGNPQQDHSQENPSDVYINNLA